MATPAELQKYNAKKILNQMKNSGGRDRSGGTPAPIDRREQRRLDQAAGLVPFAVKLNGALIKQLHDLAGERKAGINEVVAELLNKALKK